MLLPHPKNGPPWHPKSAKTQISPSPGANYRLTSLVKGLSIYPASPFRSVFIPYFTGRNRLSSLHACVCSRVGSTKVARKRDAWQVRTRARRPMGHRRLCPVHRPRYKAPVAVLPRRGERARTRVVKREVEEDEGEKERKGAEERGRGKTDTVHLARRSRIHWQNSPGYTFPLADQRRRPSE